MNEPNLARAVIELKTRDYLSSANSKKQDKLFLDFCMNSLFFDFLTIGRLKYYKRVLELKKGLKRNGKTFKKTYEENLKESS